MEKKYWYSDGNEKFGVYSLEELKSREIKPDYLVWREGVEQWTRADEFEETKSLFANLPPALPKSPPPLQQIAPPLQQTERVIQSNEVVKSKDNTKMFAIGGGVILLLIVCYFIFKPSDYPAQTYSQETTPNVTTTVEDNGAAQEEEKITQRKEYIKNNYQTFYEVSASWDTKTLGGLTNVVVSVNNTSEYPIDNIVIAVRVITSDGEVYDIQYLYFDKIKALQQASLEMSETNRGVSCGVSIAEVKADYIGLNFSLDY